jgi:hypothetical protein
VLAADLGEAFERVDGAGVRGAALRRDAERGQIPSEVGGDRGLQRLGCEPEAVVARQHAHLLGPEAEDPGRAGDRGVRLVGDVEDEVVAH